MQKLSMITKIIKGISLFTETDGESGIVGISTYWDDADNVFYWYLLPIFEEAARRAYNFDRNKVEFDLMSEPLPVTEGQMEF